MYVHIDKIGTISVLILLNLFNREIYDDIRDAISVKKYARLYYLLNNMTLLYKFGENDLIVKKGNHF